MKKVTAIILAAGKGSRMGKNINKQFLEIKNKPILYYSLKAFEENNNITNIVLVCAKEERDYCKKNIVQKFNFGKVSTLIEGGAERQDSVRNALKSLKPCDIVLIHDGARPFVTQKIIEDGIKYAETYGACTCGVKPKDTIKVKNELGFSVNTPERDTLFIVQTPQCFKYGVILEGHKKLEKDGFTVTDDTMVVETYGEKVFLYEGAYTNIKITTPEDLLIGEKILDEI